MFTHINVECHYEICTNVRAFEVEDIPANFTAYLHQELNSVTYLVYKGQVKFDLPEIHTFCHDDTP